MFTFPIIIIGVIILLSIQLSWPGFLGIMVVVFVVPIIGFISKGKGANIVEANKYKDKRIEMTT